MSWTLIESQTLGSSAASVTLGSGGTIPQTYKTLKVVCSLRNNYSGGGAANLNVSFNAITSGYTDRTLQGYGTGVASNFNVGANGIYSGPIENNGWTANTFNSVEITIPNYGGSTNKPVSIDVVTENNATTSYQQFTAGLMSNTAAITSIKFTPEASTGDFLAGCTFTLYGLK